MIKTLILEDDPFWVKIILGHLDTRFSIKVIDRLSEALSDPDHYELIITDLQLPDSKYLDTLKRISVNFPTTPIIILTSFDDLETRRLALQLNAQDFISKGEFNQDVLTHSISNTVLKLSNSKEKLTDIMDRILAKLKVLESKLLEKK